MSASQTKKKPRLPRSRAGLVKALFKSPHWEERHYEGATWQFCFNVKLYHLNLTFDHLLDVYQRSGYGHVEVNDATWIAGCRELWQREFPLVNGQPDEQPQNLMDWGCEAATDSFVGGGNDRFGFIPNDEGHLCDTVGKPVDVRFQFFGRSGGWLALTYFDGCITARDFRESAEDPMPPVVYDLSCVRLRRLYAYLLALAEQANPAAACQEVEHQAAFSFFDNLSVDVFSPLRARALCMTDAEQQRAIVFRPLVRPARRVLPALASLYGRQQALPSPRRLVQLL